MKVQHLSLGFSWPAPEQAIPSSPSSSSSLSSASSSSSSSSTANHPKRLRPLAPKLSISAAVATSPQFMTAKFASTRNLDSSSLMQSGGGSGTRWNPMPEQIKVLEALYQGGMRTPNPAQIERITAELGRYGRIEGKNVFYWFQNHKARERQKQKRSAALLALAANNSPLSNNNLRMKVQLAQKDETKKTMAAAATKKKKELEAEEGSGCCKRKCRSWRSAVDESGATDRTLELFPLRPEWKQMG